MQGATLKLRLFLEGVEVPVIGAVINAAPGSPASANIQVVPTDRVFELLPRTTVHCFWYDFTAEELGEYLNQEETEEAFLERYKLLFSGEVITLQESVAHNARQATLGCLDISLYWDTAYQYMLTYGPSGSGILGSPATFLGSNTNLFDDIINDPVSVTANLISSGKPRTPGLEDAKGLMGGIIRLLESMGGVWYTDESKLKVRGINDFFTLAELRLKILQQIGAEVGDNTAERIFQAKVFSQWLQGSLGGGGGLMSFRDILNVLFSYIYYNVTPNPVAMYQEGGEKDRKSSRNVGRMGDGSDEDLAKIIQRERDELYGLLKFDESFLPLPDWSDQAEALGVAEARGIGTRVVTSNTAVQEFASRASPGSLFAHKGIYFSEFLAEEAERLHGETVVSAYMEVAGFLRQAGEAIYGAGGPSTAETLHQGISDSASLLDQALAALSTARNATESYTHSRMVYPRLYSQIFLPDIWMCAPPRCNVWFPDQYRSLQYQRAYLREVTRMQLSTSLELVGPHPLLDTTYVVPLPDRLRGEEVKHGEGTSPASEFMLFDHEICGGIVPKISRMSEVGFYANRAQRKLTDATARSSSAVFAYRAAHFNFFKRRFAPRVLKLSGGPNPYAVVGMPALIMRRGLSLPSEFNIGEVLDLVNAGAKELRLGFGTDATGKTIVLPTQYLGMTSSLTHVFNQKGGTTSASFTYARAHRTRWGEDDQFLDIQKEEPAVNSFVTTFDLDTEIAASAGKDYDYRRLLFMRDATFQGMGEDRELQVGSKGPKGGVITKIETEYPVRFREIGEERVLVADKVKITERLTEGQLSEFTIEKPFEEVVRPSWFAPIYANSYDHDDGTKGGIGPDFYQKLLGVGSVVDEQQASNLGELSGTVLVTDNEEADERPEVDTESAQVAADRLQEIKETLEASHVEVNQMISISKAADYLATLYGYLAGSNLSTAKFSSAYRRRPVATLVQVLGSMGLSFGDDGTVENGQEGFHSRAFGPYEECELLLDTDEKGASFQRLDGSDEASVDLTADPRKKKWERVQAYAEELRRSVVLRG